MHCDDRRHRLGVREPNVVEEAPPEEGVGKLFFVVRSDDHHRPDRGANGFTALADVELHAIEFLQKVVGKFDVGLVDLVDQKHRARSCRASGEGLPQLSVTDVVAHIADARISELAVAQSRDGVILVETLLSLRGRLDVPRDQRSSEGGRDFLG